MKWVADEAFDVRLGVDVDELREEFVGALVVGLQQEWFEQRVDLGRRLLHRSTVAALRTGHKECTQRS